MPTSGVRRAADDGLFASAGFTLLEIIVVLAIMGLVAAVVAPSVIRGIESWRRQAQADELEQQLRALPGLARGAGRAITIDNAALADAVAPLRAAPGWTLSVPQPWTVRANGVCGDGELLARSDTGQERAWQVRGPFCDPVPYAGTGG